ncbi:hypothetical protein VTN77DRAFT_8550 [Rasamsonia byssochlamydoides]|uniref:uncharacterized protein n=1 Tax=Rasamsonia byssochlamydoides TaxID=89139 RepID=UPI0037422663
MRYENWDVLLFPEGSKVPIQEFRTQCFVTRDRESPYLLTSAFVDPSPFYPTPRSVGQLPVLTAFIPSLPQNSAFRVSIHSWEKPRPSRTMESFMQPDDAVLYEVRIFVDGLCVAGSIFSQRTAWPHVIDLSSQVDKNGNQDSLRFPPFHQEILQQSHWDAGELHGRIRVTISEGFSRPHRSPPFERFKDIISFSFQHAPLHILEYSNIAWPNAGMWCQIPCNMFKYHSGSGYSGYSDSKEADDAHAHSPTRHETRKDGNGSSQTLGQPIPSTWPYRIFPTPLPHWSSGTRDPRFAPQDPPLPDPFTEPFVGGHGPSRRARSTLEDVPMPDYVGSSSTSSRAISNMTGISFEHSKQPSITAPADDEQYNELIEAMSPTKPLATGTFAPTNTPSSVPTTVTRPSAAAKARTASYSQSGCRQTVLKEVPQPGTRDVSGSSAKSGPAMESIVETITTRRVHVSPSGNIKGKKETKGLCSNKENEPDGTSGNSSREMSKVVNNQPRVVVRTSPRAVHASSEIKRKRPSSKSLDESCQTNNDDTITLSPSKKMSRVERRESTQQESIDDIVDIHPQAGTDDIGEID